MSISKEEEDSSAHEGEESERESSSDTENYEPKDDSEEMAKPRKFFFIHFDKKHQHFYVNEFKILYSRL
jgi:hypothetical protein